jgi:hypothetical protein
LAYKTIDELRRAGSAQMGDAVLSFAEVAPDFFAAKQQSLGAGQNEHRGDQLFAGHYGQHDARPAGIRDVLGLARFELHVQGQGCGR